MRLLDPHNHPRCDLPPPAARPRTYVIATTPRTGSTLLCRLLTDTGLVGAPSEYLNPMQRRDWSVRRGQHHLAPLRGLGLGVLRLLPWPHAAMQAHLDEVRQHRSGGGWFGLKLHHHHFRALRAEAVLGEVALWVRLSREDRLAQAVSWARALQSGQWTAAEPRRRRPIYSRALIQRCLDAIAAGEAGWEAWLAAHPAPTVRLSYEALAADPRAATGAVLAALGAAGEVSGVGTAPELVRQADAESAQWRARFLSGG